MSLRTLQALPIDDIGYVEQSRDEMEVLFTLLAERYERGSVLLTSNLPFSQWERIFKDPMTTAAAIDRPVHPHVRGGYHKRQTRSTRDLGSPPRAWGLRRKGSNYDRRKRFTPTCVGTTRQCQWTGCGSTVHPHVRGDYKMRTPVEPVNDGSPPRAWGLRRVCGDAERELGSPPRAWGLLGIRVVFPLAVRFTPTCVGTTIILVAGW